MLVWVGEKKFFMANESVGSQSNQPYNARSMALGPMEVE